MYISRYTLYYIYVKKPNKIVFKNLKNVIVRYKCVYNDN